MWSYSRDVSVQHMVQCLLQTSVLLPLVNAGRSSNPEARAVDFPVSISIGGSTLIWIVDRNLPAIILWNLGVEEGPFNLLPTHPVPQSWGVELIKLQRRFLLCPWGWQIYRASIGNHFPIKIHYCEFSACCVLQIWPILSIWYHLSQQFSRCSIAKKWITFNGQPGKKAKGGKYSSQKQYYLCWHLENGMVGEMLLIEEASVWVGTISSLPYDHHVP